MGAAVLTGPTQNQRQFNGKPLAWSLLLHALLFATIFFFTTRYWESLNRRAPLIIEIEDAKTALQSKPSTRVVQTQQREKSEKAAPDAFLGKQTQTVDRQTVGSQISITNGPQTQKRSAKGKSATKEALKKMGGLASLGIPILPKADSPNLETGNPNRLGEEWKSDLQAPQEYIKGMKRAEATALNTKEYVFYGYFQRIRERLDLAWSRTLRDQLTKYYRRGRQLASDTDHVTRTLVTLDGNGTIVRIQVLEESGVRDLDDAAIDAFNKAGPFPNPPRGLIDTAGVIQIRWDFILKT